MKKNITIQILTLLTIAFLWSCEQDTAKPSSPDEDITFRSHNSHHNPGGGDGGGGGSTDLWEVVYDGDIITSDLAYVKLEKNTSKYAIISEACDGISTTLYGLNNLFLLSGLNDCFENSECSTWIHLRQFDKRKLPERLAAHFWFEDPVAPGETIWFSMYGTMSGDFPPTGTTTVEFDKWTVRFGASSSGEPCERENDFFAEGTSNQSMSIRLVDQEAEGDAATLCAAKEPGCIN